MFGKSLYWRETHKQPKFLFLDGRLVLVIFLQIMHIRIWTISLTVFAILVLWFFGRKGISADSILRFIRARIVGNTRTARGHQAQRMPVDFGFETEGHVEQMRKRISLEEKRQIGIREKMNAKRGRKASMAR